MARSLVAWLAVGLVAGCGDSRLPVYELAGPVMGTSYSVKLVAPPANVDLDALGRQIGDRLEEIEQRFSTYRPTSELSRLNAALTTDWVPTSAELCGVIEDSIALSRLTNGAFDVTVGPLVNLWGFGPDGDRSAPPDDNLVAEARSGVGYEKLDTDCAVPAVRKALPGVYIDLSAIAKGHAVDEVAMLLVGHGIGAYLVEIGGELRMRGQNAEGKNWAIAIEKPADSGRTVQLILPITDHAVATSGDYRNFFEHGGVRYSHTIDPRTGRPVTHDGAAVTVVGLSAAEVDALATALLVLGPEEGLALANHEGMAAYFLIRNDGEINVRSTAAFDALVDP